MLFLSENQELLSTDVLDFSVTLDETSWIRVLEPRGCQRSRRGVRDLQCLRLRVVQALAQGSKGVTDKAGPRHLTFSVLGQGSPLLLAFVCP